MKTALLTQSMMLTLLLLRVPSLHGQTYCQPNVQMACFYGDKITRVQFAGIDHSDNVCNADADGKKDFTSSVAAAQVSKGTTYTLTVTFSVNSSVGAYAWLDFNDDGTFQTTEAFNLGTRTSSGDLSVSIPIPATAVSGTTRLRIMNRKNNVNPGPTAADACHSIGNYRGQLKDYAVTITGGGLPVVLLSFNAERQHRSATLHWITETERDNALFRIERSQDGENWSLLSETPAKGNSTERTEYTATDPDPTTGITYYRLWQIDNNGTSTLLGHRSIEAEQSGEVVWPNPFGDELLVSGNYSEILLFDNSWRLLQLHISESGHEAALKLETGSLERGMYYLLLRENGSEHSFRLIKE